VLDTAELLVANVHEPHILSQLFADCDAVVNLVGILNPRGRATFETVHTQLAAKVLAAARRAGREIDPEHFGLSIPYARVVPGAELLGPLAARRPDINPMDLVPVGRTGLRDLIQSHVDAGLSKFVLRPLAPVASWPEEAAWLVDSILDLQT